MSRVRLPISPDLSLGDGHYLPRHLPIRTERRNNLIEPNIGRLQGLVEDIKAGCAHRSSPSFGVSPTKFQGMARNIVPGAGDHPPAIPQNELRRTRRV